MTYYRAIAYNKDSMTFVFHFYHQNWNDINVKAAATLVNIIKDDPLHQKNGPWYIRNIDVA